MNAKRRAKITALGRYVPPKVVTNYDLAKRVDTNHDWIVERTGIIQRHMVEPGTPTSELAAQAVGDLLRRRGAQNRQVAIDLRGVGVDDHAIPLLCQRKRQCRLAAGGRSGDDDERRTNGHCDVDSSGTAR